jgi:peptidoglycan-N-acetylglucosamine deacetylase
MLTSVQILWITICCLVVLFVIYSILPNVFVRVFHWHCVWRGPATRSVALTFDDGPDPHYTPRVLDVLKDAGVKATFFVIAEKALKYPNIIHRMMREGHEIQVHGYTHACVPLLLPSRSRKQLRDSAQALHQVFGIRTSLYRPTWGLCNWVVLAWLHKTKHKLVTWSVIVGDWRKTTWETLMNRILRKLHPGAIIVLHDSDETFGSEHGAPNAVIEMLPKLIEHLRSQGYDFSKVSDW